MFIFPQGFIIFVKFIFTTQSSSKESSDDFNIELYSNEDIINVFNQYKNELEHKISNMSKLPDIKNTLVKDLKIVENDLLFEFNVAVLDVGGSFFKIAMVNIKKEFNKFVYKITSVQNFPFPAIPKGIVTGWDKWVTKQYLSYMSIKGYTPDFASLIFSYPIKYDKNKKATPSILSKHWCFENKEILKSDLQENLNNEILSKLTNTLYPEYMVNRKNNFLIKSVLNDSIATLLSSKVFCENSAIGVILGTGTNGAFIIKHEGKDFVFNTEWGSFKPKDIKLLKEEQEFIDNLKTYYNYLDVLIGNGYKNGILNQIIKTRKINLGKIEGNNIADIMCRDNTDGHKKILNQLITRSRQLIIALICASIDVIKEKKVTILLNGSQYDKAEERDVFEKNLKFYATNVFRLNIEIEIIYEIGYTFHGAAYYALAKYFLN